MYDGRNSDHFAQVKDTLFVEGIFREHLNPFQQNAFSESILQGTIDLEKYDLNEAIKACIREMQHAEDGEPRDSPAVNSDIMIQDFQRGFRRVAEKTSSSPSRRHIGHYKAILKDDTICMVYSPTLMLVPFQFGLPSTDG